MLQMNRTFSLILILFFFLFILLFTGCMYNVKDIANVPAAVNGIIDFSDVDLDKSGIISLDGEWEFYWNELLTPDDFKNNTPPKTGLIEIPGLWNDYIVNGEALPSDGFATFRLIISNPDRNKIIALRITDINTAYKLWIDDNLAAETGVVGTSKKEMTPLYIPKLITFKPGGKNIEIIIQISNYYHKKSGIIKRIEIGSSDILIKNSKNNLSFDLFLIGALFVMMTYHFGLYIIGKRENALLYFGLFCTIIFLRTLVTGERILIQFLPFLYWEITFRMEILPVFLGSPIFLLFLKSIFPAEINDKVLNIFTYSGLIGTLIILIIPTNFFHIPFKIYLIVIGLSCVYIIFSLTIATIKKQEGALFLVIGFFVFFITVVNDILYSELNLGTSFIAPAGLIFIFLSELTLNLKFVRAEERLKTSEEKTKALLNTIPDSMFQINSNGIILDYKISDSFPTISNFNNLIGSDVKHIFPKKLSTAITDKSKIVVKSNTPQVFENKVNLNGKKIYYEVRMIKSGANNSLIILRNITESKMAEEQAKIQEEKLLHADKMITLGTLVAGVAHEINNPNNSILLTTEILAESWQNVTPILDKYLNEYGDFPIGGYRYSDLKEEAYDSYLRVIRNSKRIKRIITQLKNYARKDIYISKEEIDINSLVQSSIHVVENQIEESTDNFHLSLNKKLPTFLGQYQHIEQVLINLIQNACESLKDKQKGLYISTSYSKKNKYIIITIRDEGEGMDKETKKRIFDPFFTTKRDKGGTGLGLSISASIIKDHGGTMEFESELNKGTNARIVLPVNEK